MGRHAPRQFEMIHGLAEAGDPEAQYRLGLHYATSETGRHDLLVAHMWLNLAAAGGETRARAERQEIAGMLSPAEIAEAQKMARAFTIRYVA
ncbi:MAG: hypothetical protein VYB54_02975 [Pseudomonadota bacterium]|nr:hypothetical protein [Pseudomonadota bacterium]